MLVTLGLELQRGVSLGFLGTFTVAAVAAYVLKDRIKANAVTWVGRRLPALLDDRRPTGAPHDQLITFVTDRPGHDKRYAIDPTRIRTELGWRPSVTWEEGLAKTVDWYLANEDWWRPLLDVAMERRGTG